MWGLGLRSCRDQKVNRSISPADSKLDGWVRVRVRHRQGPRRTGRGSGIRAHHGHGRLELPSVTPVRARTTDLQGATPHATWPCREVLQAGKAKARGEGAGRWYGSLRGPRLSRKSEGLEGLRERG